MFRAAFYKGTRPGVAGLYNRSVRWWCSGKYSHCEIVFSDGVSASSSFVDGGVRFKTIDFDAANWDFIELPAHLEQAARQWFEANEGHKYDVLGNIGFLFRPIRGEQKAYFCSEALMRSLGVKEAWRYDPCCAYSTLTLLFSQEG